MKNHLQHHRAMDLAVLVAALAASAIVALSLGQDDSWDQKNYHYYAGYALLNKPLNFDFAPAQVQSFFNPLVHVTTYLMLRYLPGRATTLILGVIQGLNFWLIYRISKRLFSRARPVLREAVSLTNAATALCGAASIAELGTTFGDNLISILPLTALLILVNHYLADETLDRRGSLLFFLAGLIIGVSVGLKLTTAVYAASTVAAVFAVTLLSRRSLNGPAVICLGMSLGFIAGYGFWGTALYREYQNPFFPYLNNVFHSRFYAFANYMDIRFMPRDWKQVLFYPFYFAQRNELVSEYVFRDIRLAMCYLIVLLLGVHSVIRLCRRTGKLAVARSERGEVHCLVFLTIFIILSYGLWEWLFSIYRYAVLLEFLAPVFISAALWHLSNRTVTGVLVVLLVNVAICTSVVPLDFGRRSFVDDPLRVRPPDWNNLAQSVVLMSGDEGTSYIIPSFPATTRFVRVESNFVRAGENLFLDRKIEGILSRYGSDRTLVYVHGMEEIAAVAPAVSYYGITIDVASCTEVRAPTGDAGYLCRALGKSGTGRRADFFEDLGLPVLVRRPGVGLVVTPTEVVTNRDTLTFKVINMKALAIDVLYSIDGALAPPIRRWLLDANMSTRIFVSAQTQKGLYHIFGVRDSYSPARNEWVRVDVEVRVK